MRTPQKLPQFAFLVFCFLLGWQCASAQVSLDTVIAQALHNSPKVRMNTADVLRAQAGLAQSKDVYWPSFTVGGGFGPPTYGFPVGEPSILNVSANSLAFSFSQRDYIRSARQSLQAAQLQLSDARQQVILDASLDYIELLKVLEQIAVLGDEGGFAQKLIAIEQDRVEAGRDAKVELTRARLTAAEVELKRIQLSGQADLLRSKLAHLTGFPAADITPQAQSVPPIAPDLDQTDSEAAIRSGNSGVQAAFASAKAKQYVAFGDARQNNHPIFNLGMQYERFAKYNNYNEYYLRFQQNNFNAGFQVQVPLFDASRKAKARASSADAAHAAAEADLLLDQTSEQVLQLQKNITELAAQENVADLQAELAQDQLAAVTTQLQSGSGGPNATPLTPKDEQQAHIDERRRYVDMLDARFQLTQAQLNLLRSLGEIEDWAKTAH